MKEEKIKVIIIEPNKLPRVEMVDNELHAMQVIVGGNIEVVPFHNFDLVCNEEGKLMGLPPTLDMSYDVIMGTCFITKADDEGEMISLTNEDVELAMPKLIERTVS